MDIEYWKYIKGYEGLYMVSTKGRIKSVDHYIKSKGGVRLVKGKILKQDLIKGYLRVTLFKDGVSNHYLVHRLVAEAFIENLNKLPSVNHKDENKLNNCVDNLEWCTQTYQINYGDRNNKVATKLSKPVLQYTLDMVLVAEYPSANEAERQTGIKQSQITNCCNGKYGFKTAGGYIWEYK